MTTELATYDLDARLGPAMAALSERQRQFVTALVTTGCSQAKAAQLAGYQGDADSLKSTGWRLAHDHRCQAAILEESQKLIRSTAVMAVNVLKELAEAEWIDPKVRVKAAVELLNRSGLSAVTEHKVTVERQRSEGEQIEDIKRLAANLNIDARRLLGDAGVPADIIDAEFAVITGPDGAS